jgi:hypothetical protein
MPAINAARTLRQTCAELPRDVVDEMLLVDDHSSDTGYLPWSWIRLE